ncbi:hypothetical protein ACVWXO_001935 [Bradyrhizobium sp. LM2.7]
MQAALSSPGGVFFGRRTTIERDGLMRLAAEAISLRDIKDPALRASPSWDGRPFEGEHTLRKNDVPQ